MWPQVYDPFGSMVLSTLVAAIPIVVLLGAIGLFHMKAHYAAGLGLLASLAVAIVGFGMPVGMASMSAVYGAAYGMLPIGWIILNVIFLYQLTNEKGEFTILQDSIASITRDRRLQLLLIAFCFGAFFEGAAGFGTPVAVTGAMLIGLGFSPLAASGLSLIANTAPVAYGALGTPIIALSAVTGLDLLQLSGMIGRQLPFFSVIVPFWLIWAFVGLPGHDEHLAGPVGRRSSPLRCRSMLVSNFHGPWLVDVVAAIVSMAALALFLRGWKPRGTLAVHDPRQLHRTPPRRSARRSSMTASTSAAPSQYTRGQVIKAWVPWIILSVFVFLWGVPQIKAFLDSIWILKIPVEGLHNLVQKVPPVVAAPVAEPAIYSLNLLSATGTGILLAAIVSGFVLGYSPLGLIRMYFKTFYLIRFSLLTIAGMLALGYVTKYSGTDATLGLAFAQTGWLYPLFGTMLGWLGVALTGSDTSSNVLFGGLQKITSEQLGLNPVLMASANSSGGVMGKMIDAQSIVVASTATRWYGHEGDILRYVFFHSLALAVLVGLLIMAQAYVWPFTALVY